MSHEFNFEVIPISEAIKADLLKVPEEDLERPVVLIVDDEPLIVESLAAILARSGFRVLKAYNGHAALQVAQRSAPELLITDVAMPGMDGIELAMKMVIANPDCKVLLFSAHASSLDLTPARRAGYDFPLLAKPVHPKQMLARVMECLEQDIALAS